MSIQNAPSISLNSVIRQSPNLVSADMGGEIAMMSIENGKYYCLNETGSRIWELIEQQRRIAEICSTLEVEFAVAPEQCEAEVLKQIEELLAHKLAELVEVGNAAAA